MEQASVQADEEERRELGTRTRTLGRLNQRRTLLHTAYAVLLAYRLLFLSAFLDD
jgi:hypothetical protein